MHRESDILRLIYCLAGSFILHVFILFFSVHTFWNPAGSSWNPDHSALYQPLTVRLAVQEPLLAIAPLPKPDVSPPLLLKSQIEKPQVVKTSSATPSPSTQSPASGYHDAKDLSRMPELIEQPPEVIEISQDTSGEVVFKLFIDQFGKVRLVHRLKSSLPREIEGKLAWQLYRAEYRPGEIGGIAVNSEMIVDLKLTSGGWITDTIPVLRQDKAQEKP